MIHITDHAMLRYLERYKGLCREKLKKEIVDKYTQKQIAALGTGTYHKDNIKLKVVGGTIVTVM